jgi:threonine/homoserine/homoserine lactone efflux protein
MHLLFIFFLGWLLSFLGQLPLGTISITATQIAVQENFSNAWKYIIGVVIIEMFYLRIVLSGVDWIMDHKLFFSVLGWLTVLLFLILGIWSFATARKQRQDKKALLLTNSINRFWLGVTMSTLNPAQIPFWFVWSSYFMSVKWLYSGFEEFNLFTIGAGLGTVTGLIVYSYGGTWLVTKMNTSNRTLNKIMGVIFIIAALAQLYRMVNHDLLD